GPTRSASVGRWSGPVRSTRSAVWPRGSRRAITRTTWRSWSPSRGGSPSRLTRVSEIVVDDDPFQGFDDSIAGDVRDPYPALAAARAATSVLRQDPELDGQPDGFMVYPYALVSQVLRDNETFSSAVLREVMGP